jgi:hypothetical protein
VRVNLGKNCPGLGVDDEVGNFVVGIAARGEDDPLAVNDEVGELDTLEILAKFDHGKPPFALVSAKALATELFSLLTKCLFWAMIGVAMKKNNSLKPEKFSAREVAVLLEDLRGQFKAFGEGLEALRDDVGGIKVNQAKTLERVTMLEITVRKIQSDVAEIKESIKGQDKRLATLETAK